MLHIFALCFVIFLYIIFKPVRYKNRVVLRDATKPIYEPDTFYTKHVPVLSGITLKIFAYLSNTIFGKYVLGPQLCNDGYLELKKFREQFCNIRPTFFPIKRPLPGSCELAKDDDKIPNTSSLQNKFPSGWKPITIQDYTDAYNNRTTNPTLIAKDIVEKIRLVNDELYILCDWSESLIMEAAAESTRRYNAGKTIGPFDGVPIIIKDQFHVKGLTMRTGFEFPVDKPSEHDSVIVERIKARGMIIIGLANMHQNGMGVTGINPSKFHGTTRNPVNPEYHAGGSSSGTAVAISVGLVPIGIGTDGGGSVRIPASFTNTSALKPSFGRVPVRGFCGGTNSHTGPMANTMIDCTKLYSVIAGPDFTNESEISWYQPKVDVPTMINKPLKGLRIGIDYNWLKFTDTDVLKVFEDNLRKLELEGAEMISIKIPDLVNMCTAHFITFTSESSQSVSPYIEENDYMNPDTALALHSIVDVFTSHDYLLALKLRTKLMDEFEKIFKGIDLIASPTCPSGTSKIDPAHEQSGVSNAKECAQLVRGVKVFNFTGLPAISTPMGYDRNDMPIGLHFAANWWNESKLLEIGAYLEESFPRRKPKLFLPNKLL